MTSTAISTGAGSGTSTATYWPGAARDRCGSDGNGNRDRNTRYEGEPIGAEPVPNIRDCPCRFRKSAGQGGVTDAGPRGGGARKKEGEGSGVARPAHDRADRDVDAGPDDDAHSVEMSGQRVSTRRSAGSDTIAPLKAASRYQATTLHDRSDKGTDPGRDGHRERAPEGDAQRRLEDGSAAGPRAEQAKQCQKHERPRRHGRNEPVRRRDQDERKRRRRAHGKRRRRCQRSLDRTGRRELRNAEFVARVRRKRVSPHELARHLTSKVGVEAARHIDTREFILLECRIRGEFPPLAPEIGMLGIATAS